MNISKLLVYVDCFVCDVGGVCRIDDFRQVHSRRQKAVAEIVAERLHVSDLEKYVDSEYSGRYVDAILCEELKSSMLDVYNRVCDVERRSRILMSHNPSMAKFKDDLKISTALWMLTTIALKTTNCGSIRLFRHRSRISSRRPAEAFNRVGGAELPGG